MKITYCVLKQPTGCQNDSLFAKVKFFTDFLSKLLPVCQNNLVFVEITCCLHGNLLFVL